MRLAPLIVLTCLIAPIAAAADALTLHVHNRLDQPREAAAVTCGVPLAKGFIGDVSELLLRDGNGTAIPVQALETASYKDGSPRWVLLDFQVDLPAAGAAQLVLQTGRAAAPRKALAYGIEDGVATVDTGAAVFRIATDAFDGFGGIEVGGTQLLGSGGGAVLEEAGGATHRGSDVTDAAFEDDGPLHAVLAVRGRFKPGGKLPLANYVCRIHFYAGKSFARVFYTLHNPQAQNHPGNTWDLGRGGSVFVEDLSLTLPLADAQWSSRIGHEDGAIGAASKIYQDSSGGENWQSANHVDKDMNVPTSFRGYKLYDGEREAGAGHRADGWLHARSEHGGVAVAVREFWQNFPKALAYDASGIRIALFPREFAIPHEIVGGEQKTHELLIYAHDDQTSDADVARVMNEFHSPIYVIPDPERVLAGGAFLPAAPADPERDPALEQTVGILCYPGKGSDTIRSKWEQIDEYGWRHFGDTWADNERSPAKMAQRYPKHHFGRRPISHYGNEYEVNYTALLHGIRRNDPEFLWTWDVMSRHYADICINHTEHDAPAYSHAPFTHTTHNTAAFRSHHRMHPSEGKKFGIRYDSGGPNAGHCYVAHLAQHYYLTGDRVSREAFLEVADWTVHSPWFERKMYVGNRGMGNFITTHVYAYQMTGEQKYYDAAMTILQDVPHANEGLHATLLVRAAGRFLDMKNENGEGGDDDAQAMRTMMMKFGEHYLSLPDDKPHRWLEQTGFWVEVLATCYLHAADDHPQKDAFFEKADALMQHAAARWPGKYVPTKSWVMSVGHVGAFTRARAARD